MFADLFPSGRGRPSITADVVASVLVLQALHGLSDRQAAESVMFDLRWKAACGLAVDGVAFHPTVLTYWRRRLAASTDPNRIFDAVKDVIAKTGALTGKTRRALHSTVLDDAVATQDTVTQLDAAIRRVARVVPGADVVVAERTSVHDYSKPGKPDIAWDDVDARAALIHGLVSDALAVLGAVTAPGAEAVEEDSPAGRAAALLALIAGQDVEWVPDPGDNNGGGGRWQIARNVVQDRVINRVAGGASVISAAGGRPFEQRWVAATDEKETVARAAAPLLAGAQRCRPRRQDHDRGASGPPSRRPDRCQPLGAGRPCLHRSRRHRPDRHRRLYHPPTRSFTGPLIRTALASFAVDVAVLSATAVDGSGVYSANASDANTKRAMADIVRRVVLLLDHGKLTERAPMQIMDLRQVETVVIDAGASTVLGDAAQPVRTLGGGPAAGRNGQRSMSGPWLGVVADDITGACDLADAVCHEGQSAVVRFGPGGRGDPMPPCDCAVVAVQSRTAPTPEAVGQSVDAAQALLVASCTPIYQKCCSTFDSTDRGNIGPVADALRRLVPGSAPSVAVGTPATPRSQRIVHQGHPFVGRRPLSESSLRDHPLTPMRDSDLEAHLAIEPDTGIISTAN